MEIIKGLQESLWMRLNGISALDRMPEEVEHEPFYFVKKAYLDYEFFNETLGMDNLVMKQKHKQVTGYLDPRKAYMSLDSYSKTVTRSIGALEFDPNNTQAREDLTAYVEE